MTRTSTRPVWARVLDRAVGALLAVTGRLLPRPNEGLLERLARRDRPAPSPVRRRVTVESGRSALSAGAHAEALHRFDQVLSRDPDNAWALHGRGDALQLLGEHTGALDAYTRAAERQPGEGLHQGGQANALAALGRQEEAEAAWRRALHLDPTLRWMRPGGDDPPSGPQRG